MESKLMKKNVVIQGDSIEIMNKLPAESVDLIFADPPYFMRTNGKLVRVEGTDYNGVDDEWDKFNSFEEYKEFTKDWLSACYRVLKPNGSIWVIGGMQCIYAIGGIMMDLGFWLINDVVWHKTNPTPNFMGTRLNNSHETMIWATKSEKAKYTFHYKTAKELNTDNILEEDFSKGIRKQMGSVWRYSVVSGNDRLKDAEGNKLHSTQKPLEMLERIVAICSNKGDLVLDPFGGTMTTGVAAKKLGRSYIMIEKDGKYCEYGRKRLDETKEEINDIANAVFDVKPKKVSLSEMIEKHFFVENEGLYFRDSKEPVGYLLKDGNILLNGEKTDIHSGGAKARGVKAKRINGFDYWYVMRNNKLKSISDIREEYRQTLED